MKGKDGKNQRVTRKEQSKSCSILTVMIVLGQPSPETEVNDLVFMFKDRKHKFERISVYKMNTEFLKKSMQ